MMYEFHNDDGSIKRYPITLDERYEFAVEELEIDLHAGRLTKSQFRDELRYLRSEFGGHDFYEY